MTRSCSSKLNAAQKRTKSTTTGTNQHSPREGESPRTMSISSSACLFSHWTAEAKHASSGPFFTRDCLPAGHQESPSAPAKSAARLVQQRAQKCAGRAGHSWREKWRRRRRRIALGWSLNITSWCPNTNREMRQDPESGESWDASGFGSTWRNHEMILCYDRERATV